MKNILTDTYNKVFGGNAKGEVVGVEELPKAPEKFIKKLLYLCKSDKIRVTIDNRSFKTLLTFKVNDYEYCLVSDRLHKGKHKYLMAVSNGEKEVVKMTICDSWFDDFYNLTFYAKKLASKKKRDLIEYKDVTSKINNGELP